jgi:tetratricopeptide (TPR) repeat protein
VRRLVGDEDLDRWLEILAQKEIVYPRQAADTREFVFRHALLEEAAYAMLGGEDRVLGHRRAGEYLESEGEREAIVLVEHFEKGGEAKKAAHWCRFAAEQALDANDLAGVIERVERGVRLGADGEGLGVMRVAEAHARWWRGEYREAESAASEATERLTGSEQLRAIGELIAASGQLARFDEVERWAETVRTMQMEGAGRPAQLDCLIRAAAYLMPAGLYDAARKLLDDIDRDGDLLSASSRARRLRIKGVAAWHDGKQAQALDAFEAAASAQQSLGDLRSATEMLANAGALVAELGLLEEAHDRMTALLSTAERFDLRFVLVYVLYVLAFLNGLLSRPDQARASGLRAVALARKQGDQRIEGMALGALSTCAYLEGRFDEAEKYAREATTTLRSIPPVLAAAEAALGQTLLQQGRAEDALVHAQAAYDVLQAMGQVEDGEAAIRLAYAQCLAAVGRAGDAKRVIEDAARRLLERASTIENPTWREAFLTRLPAHAETLKLASRISGVQLEEP